MNGAHGYPSEHVACTPHPLHLEEGAYNDRNLKVCVCLYGVQVGVPGAIRQELDQTLHTDCVSPVAELCRH